MLRTPRTTIRTASLLAALLALAPLPASAQLGGLIKRGAERAAEKAVDKKVEPKRTRVAAPTFDEEVLELTPPRVEQVAKGLRAWQVAIATADVPGAHTRWEGAQAREYALAEQHRQRREQFNDRTSEVEGCRREAFEEQDERNNERMNRRMQELTSEPAKMQAMARVAQTWNLKLAQLQQAGDTAAYRAGTSQMYNEMAKAGGFSIVVDTAAVDKTCGSPPPKPAWLVQLEEAEGETRRAAEALRTAESKGDPEGAAAAALSPRQFAIARERVEAFVNDRRMGFSDQEVSALNARRGELAAFFPK